jgi:N-acetyltransferase 10
MASTVHGYEGTGRSLSLKLIHQLRVQSVGDSQSDICLIQPKFQEC